MAPPVLGGAGLRRLGHFPCPCCRRLPPSQRSRDSKILADLAGEDVAHFRMARHGGVAFQRGIHPPRVPGTLADEDAILGAEVGNQVPAFQISRPCSSYGPLAKARASPR